MTEPLRNALFQELGQLSFSGQNVNKCNKGKFLANKNYKQRFINLLSESLEQARCIVFHSKEDVDLLILQTAIKFARSTDTVVVGDDIDL